MKRRKVVAIAAVALALALTGCAPSQAQLDCEAAGGKWASKFSHFQPIVIVSGKTTTVIQQPIYLPYCDMSEVPR